jgi:hypothetical protein
LSISDLVSDYGTLDSGIGVEHPALIGCSGGNSALIISSALYWKLERYEVEPYPVPNEVICG